MFNPTGDVEKIYLGWFGQRPLGSIHMLVGRTEQIYPSDVFFEGDDFKANLVDLDNNWISLGHRSGAVTSAEVAQTNPPDPPTTRLFDARQFARSAIDRGSR
jgi:hypothetical protein